MSDDWEGSLFKLLPLLLIFNSNLIQKQMGFGSVHIKALLTQPAQHGCGPDLNHSFHRLWEGRDTNGLMRVEEHQKSKSLFVQREQMDHALSVLHEKVSEHGFL